MVSLSREDIKRECWNIAFQCLATHYVFRRKAEKYEKYIRWNTLLGILTPLSIGAVAATYGLDASLTKYALIVAGPFSVAQALLSGIAIVNKWDSLLSYAIESQTANRIGYTEFKQLAQYPPTKLRLLQAKFKELSVIAAERETQDEKIQFTSQEDRDGHRYALWILQQKCPSCGVGPSSMIPSICGNCGNPGWLNRIKHRSKSISQTPTQNP